MFCVTVVRGVVMSDVMELQGHDTLHFDTFTRETFDISSSLVFFFAQSSHAPQSCGAGHRAIVHCQMRKPSVHCSCKFQKASLSSSARRPLPVPLLKGLL